MPVLIIRNSDNVHVSTADSPAEVASPMRAGLRSVSVGSFDPATQMWDSSTSQVINRLARAVPADETLRLALIGVPIGAGFSTQLQRDQALILLLKKIGSF